MDSYERDLEKGGRVVGNAIGWGLRYALGRDRMGAQNVFGTRFAMHPRLRIPRDLYDQVGRYRRN